MEAMTIPRTTQQMMIMIFFCTREAGRKGLSQIMGAVGSEQSFEGIGAIGEGAVIRVKGWRECGAEWGKGDDLDWV